MPDNDAEILRLRERCHELESTVEGLRLLTQDLRGRMGRIEKVLNDMVTKDAIATAIADKVNKERKLVLSGGQRLLVAAVAVLTIYSDVISLMHKH